MKQGGEQTGAHSLIKRLQKSSGHARGAPISAAVYNRFPHETGMAGGTIVHREVQTWMLTGKLPAHPYALAMVRVMQNAFEKNGWQFDDVRPELEVAHPELKMRTWLDLYAVLNGRPCVFELKTIASVIDFEQFAYDSWHDNVADALVAARAAEMQHAQALSDTEHVSFRAGAPDDRVCTPYTAALLQLVAGAAALSHSRDIPFESIVGLLVVSGDPSAPRCKLFRVHMRHYHSVLAAMIAPKSRGRTRKRRNDKRAIQKTARKRRG